jgi:transcriptional regulator with XRE-family HTH domain
VSVLAELNMGFKENLKRLRTERGWTQEQLARLLDVSLRSYTNWEADGREPRYAVLVRLARVFGVTADELLEGVGEAEEPERPAKKKRK